tara:strand:- start:915 stop:1640 length:726 start_codon:yes stop_codon:yes gene_type:complete
MNLSLNRLYNPNGKTLGSLVAGLSGSGKTTAIISTLQDAIAHPGFGEYHRFVIIDPKHQVGDYDLLADPELDFVKVQKSISQNRVTLYWPELENLEFDVGQVVEYIFDMSNSEPRSSFTLVLDEASILITPTRISTPLKRLALQGRAKRIKPVFISQRPIVNRWTDANLSNLLLFNTMPVDFDTLARRWGVNFELHAKLLRDTPYSYLWFDMEKASMSPMAPVDLPKPKPKRKRRWWDIRV